MQGRPFRQRVMVPVCKLWYFEVNRGERKKKRRRGSERERHIVESKKEGRRSVRERESASE